LPERLAWHSGLPPIVTDCAEDSLMEFPRALSWNALYVLDILAIIFFSISYYRNCYRRGYRLDFWHVQLFLICIFPNMLMLPFARSELNVLVLGNDLASVMAVLPRVFLITLAGFVAVLAGGFLWRLQIGVGIRDGVRKILAVIPDCSMMLMSSRGVLIFQAVLCLFLQFLILSLYFSQSGFAFDLRSYTFENPTIRPIALIISNYSIIIASHCLARYIDTKEKSLLACNLLLAFWLVFFGARSSLLIIYLNILICYVVKLRRNISLLRVIYSAVVVLIIGFYIGNVRGGDYSVRGLADSLFFLLFYGNNFSDLRDFAWVYSAWNHKFWAGKTYLAALHAFVPRFAWQFRDTWGLGVVTASTVGFDPQVHPGLRPGAFGEGFFNFGIFGVMAVGLMLGIISRRVDIDVKRAMVSNHPSMMRAFASSNLLGVSGCLAVSAGFSSLYVLAGIYLFSWLCLSAQRMFIAHPVIARHAE
jgi:oligosaccharide repeat unit polymerase